MTLPGPDQRDLAPASALRRGADWLLERTRRGHVRLTRGASSIGLDLRRGQIESLRVGAREVLSSPLAMSIGRIVSPGRGGAEPTNRRERRAQRDRTLRVSRYRVLESADGIEVVLELRSRIADATVTLRADGRDGILVHALVRPRREPVLVGFRAGLDSAFDRVQWARRAPAERPDSPERVGWHRRTLAQLRSAVSRDVERAGVEHVVLADGDVQVRVEREGETPFRFAFPGAGESSRRDELRAPETTLAVHLEAPRGAAAFEPREYSARFRLTWGSARGTSAPLPA